MNAIPDLKDRVDSAPLQRQLVCGFFGLNEATGSTLAQAA